MTDFQLSPNQAYTFENLEWDLTPPEGGFVRSGTLDVAALNAAQIFPDGVVKSGLVLAKNTATQLLVPYIAAGANGTGTPYGLLRASVPVTRLIGGTNRTKIGVAVLVHGVVAASKLPYTSGNAAAGGFADAAGKTALPLILWEP
jgi:hypothetical protein